MDISGASGVSHALSVKSAQMSNSHAKQEGQQVQELLQTATPPTSSNPSVGSTINTHA